MRLKKIPMDGYEANFYKTKKYTTIHLNFLFEMDYTRENIYKCDLLEEYMMNTNAVYKTKNEITEQIRRNYSLGCKMDNYNIGKKMFIEVSYTMFNSKLVQDDYLDEALEFEYNMLYKPRFENGKLDKETLEICKNNMIGSMASSLAEPKRKAYNGFIDTVFPNSYFSEDIVHSKEEYEEMLSSFTDEDLIEMYHKILDESFVGLTIMGDVDEKFFAKVRKLFKFKSIKPLDVDYSQIIKINNENKFIKVSDETINESIVYAAIECEDYDEKDRIIYDVINRMLNSPGMVMHKTLRNELKLVYSSGSSFYARAGVMYFTAFIDKKNIDKCIEGFDIILEKIQNKSFVEGVLPTVINQINISDYVSDENKWNVNNELFIQTFKTTLPRKERLELINKITTDDIVNCASKLKIKVIYFYEGAKK